MAEAVGEEWDIRVMVIAKTGKAEDIEVLAKISEAVRNALEGKYETGSFVELGVENVTLYVAGRKL